MLANSKHTNLLEHLVPVPGHPEKCLPIAAIYGANGSGKSNLVSAISWLRRAVFSNPTALGEHSIRVAPFLFAEPERPTKLSLRFLVGRQVLEYGVSFTPARFEQEWLTIVRPKGKEKIVFERLTDSKEVTTINYGDGLPSVSEKAKALKLLGAKPKELFLSRLFHDLTAEESGDAIGGAVYWFLNLHVVGLDSEYRFLTRRADQDDAFRVYLSDLLHRIDPTLAGLKVEKNNVALSELTNLQRRKLEEAEVGEQISGARRWYKAGENLVEEVTLRAEHSGPNGLQRPLEFSQESDGTRRIAHIAPAAYEANGPHVFLVDELDRSLHALLVRAFVTEFLARARGHRSQLIFTTHETHVLDQDLLRRDEIWFVQKSLEGATEIYPLDDYPVRNDLRLDRSYLLGRFGGVPSILDPS